MRNLKIIEINEIATRNELPLTATAWDTRKDALICAFGPTVSKPVIDIQRTHGLNEVSREDTGSAFSPITSWDSPSPLPDLPSDEVLLLEFFPDTSTSCLVLSGGDIVLVRDNPTPEQERIEIVGSVDAGISAAAWAPGEEVLSIVTRADTLILMSKSLEPLSETTLSPADLSASKHVSVGWGKKETQFQGKRARALRDPTIPETVDEGKLSSFDDGGATISWRGDGGYFAVNSLVTPNRRAIRVFSREAVLDSASEPVDGLESAMSWKPSGQIIAAIQRLPNRLDVVFFERNGLRHGEFTLRLSQGELEEVTKFVSLSWHPDSSLLAVIMLDRVQFWSMGNYHYYLKQEILLHTTGPTLRQPRMRWRPNHALRAVIQSSESLIDISFAFVVSRGSIIEPHDHGTALVIDGGCLKITPLRYATVPPPMAYLEVEVQHNIVDTAISKDGQFIVILTTKSLEIYKWRFGSGTTKLSKTQRDAQILRPSTEAVLIHSSPLLRNIEGASLRFTQIAIAADNQITIVSPPRLSSPGYLLSFNFKPKEVRPLEGEDVAILTHEDPVETQARGLIVDSQQKAVSSTTLLSPHLSDLEHPAMLVRRKETVAFDVQYMHRSPMPNGIEDHPTSSGHESSEPTHFCSLSETGQLAIDDHVLVSNCTSFLIAQHHLMLTTADHLLKFVHLTDPANLDIPGNVPESDERCRTIERGALLITVMPSIYAVVLQMPRGNLEMVYPRVLVLSGIRRHISEGDYRTAFLACQTHQVDLNLLHDFKPVLFMDKIELFISQLKKPGRIDEFLSKLKDEDVSRTLYRDSLDAEGTALNGIQIQTSAQSMSSALDKVNRICTAFLSVLSADPAKYLQSILTAHVCKRPPDLISALQLISELRQKSTSDADDAVSHLCFLTDPNRLYDAALSLYDLEITLLVAQNSQRDPREYLPFLQSLNSLPTSRRHFQIDDHLRNFPKALESLHELKAHNELEAYAMKHLLYTHAMTLYKYDTPHLRRASILYAGHLVSTSQNLAAATLYESLGDHTTAYPLYALAHRWRESLTCASLAGVPQDQLRSHAISLATTLAEETRDYRSAATIHLDYCSDRIAAARVLCKGSYFAEATRLLTISDSNTLPTSHPSQDPAPTTTATPRSLISSIIHPALTESFSALLPLLSDAQSQFTTQTARILHLRDLKSLDPLAFFGGDPNLDPDRHNNHDIPDNISLAPTDASTTAGRASLFTRPGLGGSAIGPGDRSTRFGGTQYTHQTSKTRRREERKRARGKPGSVYEEEYLVASVGRLVAKVNGMGGEVERVVEGLVRVGDMGVNINKVEKERADVPTSEAGPAEEVLGNVGEGRARARVVVEKMHDLIQSMRESVDKIWGQEADGGADDRDVAIGAGGEGVGRPSGVNGVLWDTLNVGVDGRGGSEVGVQRPVVKEWQVDALLVE